MIKFLVPEQRNIFTEFIRDQYIFQRASVCQERAYRRADSDDAEITRMRMRRGAGGIVTNWEGGSAEQGGRIVAAGDARVHAAALKVLQG